MKVSIVTFADLGKRHNLKTAEIMPVISFFKDRGMLESVVCRMNSGFDFANTYSAISRPAHIVIKVLERIFSERWVPSRHIEERRLDAEAFRRVKDSDIVIFHPEVSFPKTIAMLRATGKKSVVIATMAHPKANMLIEKEERGILGIKNSMDYYEKMYESYARVPAPDAVVCLSQFVLQSYLDSGFDAQRLFLANSQILEKSAFLNIVPNDEGTFRVLYMSSGTNPLKGLGYLLDAWNLVRAGKKELVIVGGFKDTPRDLQTRYEKKMTADPTIVAVPFVPHSEIGSLFARASVFAFPSLTEGNPRVVLEAMASGLPVVTTVNAPSLVEDGKSGCIVPIRNPEMLAEKLSLLSTDSALRKSFGQAGRATIIAAPTLETGVWECCQKIIAGTDTIV